MADTGPLPSGVAVAVLSTVATAAVAVAASSLYHHRLLTALKTGRDQNNTLIQEDAGAEQHAQSDDDDDPADAVYVGLVRLRVAVNDRDRVKNDVILMAAIQDVVETLYVCIDTTDARAATQYTSELLDASWHLAVAAHKPQLRIEVAAAATAPHTWDDVFALPDLGAVYGEYEKEAAGSKWLSRAGLLPVAYRSPDLELRKYFRPAMSYFDDQHGRTADGGARHAIVLVQGTFDHLHNGHKRLLSLAVGVCSERLLVGITAAPQLLAAKPFAALIEPLETRKQHVAAFVASINATVAVQFIDVHDRWGPAGSCDDTRILYVVSSSDIARWDETRARRFSLGLAAFFVRVARRTSWGTLSSRRIRQILADKQA